MVWHFLHWITWGLVICRTANQFHHCTVWWKFSRVRWLPEFCTGKWFSCKFSQTCSWPSRWPICCCACVCERLWIILFLRSWMYLMASRTTSSCVTSVSPHNPGNSLFNLKCTKTLPILISIKRGGSLSYKNDFIPNKLSPQFKDKAYTVYTLFTKMCQNFPPSCIWIYIYSIRVYIYSLDFAIKVNSLFL